MKETELLRIAKEILDLNPNAMLTGSLMLKLRGIDLDREPHDIDIIIGDYAGNVAIPSQMNVVEDEGSGANWKKYITPDFAVDVLASPELYETIIDGIKVASVQSLIKAKLMFIENGTDHDGKHKKDLLVIASHGYEVGSLEKENYNDFQF